MIDDRTAPYAALLLRLSLGALFLAHAALKVFVFTPAGTAQFFASVGVPGALAYLVIAAEVLGGIALIIGWQTRYVALALIADPVRRHRHRAWQSRLLLRQCQWRLGVPGILDRRVARAGAARGRRSQPALRAPLSPITQTLERTS